MTASVITNPRASPILSTTLPQESVPLLAYEYICREMGVDPPRRSEIKAYLKAMEGIRPHISILDVGSGYGRLVKKLFTSSGHNLTYLEPNSEYAAALREKNPSSRVLEERLEEHATTGATYGAVIISFSLIVLLPQEEQEGFLRAALTLSECVIIDTVYRDRQSGELSYLDTVKGPGGEEYLLPTHIKHLSWFEDVAKKCGKKIETVNHYALTWRWKKYIPHPVMHTLIRIGR